MKRSVNPGQPAIPPAGSAHSAFTCVPTSLTGHKPCLSKRKVPFPCSGERRIRVGLDVWACRGTRMERGEQRAQTPHKTYCTSSCMACILWTSAHCHFSHTQIYQSAAPRIAGQLYACNLNCWLFASALATKSKETGLPPVRMMLLYSNGCRAGWTACTACTTASATPA